MMFYVFAAVWLIAVYVAAYPYFKPEAAVKAYVLGKMKIDSLYERMAK